VVVEKRIGATRRAVELAREIVARGILTEEEAEAILKCKNNPRSILEITRKTYKKNASSRTNWGGRRGEEE
jgi:hypothetical protein